MPVTGARDGSRRLDHELVARGLAGSRSRAQDLIRDRAVLVEGKAAAKSSVIVNAHSRIELRGDYVDYVSRGALKLGPAIAHFGLSPDGRTCLDIGASTGGFTQVLLDGGAAKVFAVENGHGQLHGRLAVDPRVVSLERTDARRLDRTTVPEPVAAIVADVSFISLHKALPAALRLAGSGCWLVALVKPQFELGPERVPRNGVVTDPAMHAAAVSAVAAWLAAQPGWRILGTMPSPVKGGEGNSEFLIGAVHDE